MSDEIKYFYERNLPHYQPLDAMFHITFRLHGSLPIEIINELNNDYKKEISQLHKFHLNPDIALLKTQENYFKKYDSLLDVSNTGQCWLKEKDVAQEVFDSIIYRDQKEYELICFCIMPNHVHLIIENPKRQIFEIMKYLKGFTAKKCNQILKRSGTFWQAESYDHIIRERNELEDQIVYVLQNPVNAGLVQNWQDWKWTYCNNEVNPLQQL